MSRVVLSQQLLASPSWELTYYPLQKDFHSMISLSRVTWDMFSRFCGEELPKKHQKTLPYHYGSMGQMVYITDPWISHQNQRTFMDIQIVPCESVMAGKQHRGRLPGPARVEDAQQFPALKKLPREVTSARLPRHFLDLGGGNSNTVGWFRNPKANHRLDGAKTMNVNHGDAYHIWCRISSINSIWILKSQVWGLFIQFDFLAYFSEGWEINHQPSTIKRYSSDLYSRLSGAIFEMAEMTSRDKFSSGFFKQIFQVISGFIHIVMFSNDGNISCTNKKNLRKRIGIVWGRPLHWPVMKPCGASLSESRAKQHLSTKNHALVKIQWAHKSSWEIVRTQNRGRV